MPGPSHRSSGLPFRTALFVLCISAQSLAQGSLLLGGTTAPLPRTVEVDPDLPSGAVRWVGQRPTTPGERLCSTRRPLCVHLPLPEAPSRAVGDATSRAQGEAALAALERAYELLVDLEGLPPPAGDEGAGGGDELDWYLLPPATASAPLASPHPADLVVELEPLVTRGFDRATAHCRGMQADLHRSAHLCLAEASLASRAPAHAPHVRRAQAVQLWWQQGNATELDQEALGRLQARPEEGVLWREVTDRSEGAALWFQYLAARASAPASRSLLTSTALHLAGTRTPAGSLRWHAEPDVLDVLRSSFGGSREGMARFWDGFAQSRILVGRATSGAGGLVDWAVPTTRVEPTWRLPASSLPRNLALPRSLAPTGSAYFLLELDVPLSALALRATCEAPVSYVWSVARYAPDWQLLSTLPVPFKEGQRIIEQRVTELDGVTQLLVAGTHLGGVDLAHPFDPDHAPFEPHGCSVYFAAL